PGTPAAGRRSGSCICTTAGAPWPGSRRPPPPSRTATRPTSSTSSPGHPIAKGFPSTSDGRARPTRPWTRGPPAAHTSTSLPNPGRTKCRRPTRPTRMPAWSRLRTGTTRPTCSSSTRTSAPPAAVDQRSPLRVSGREGAVGTGCSSHRTGAAALIAVRWLRSGGEPTGRRGSGHHPSQQRARAGDMNSDAMTGPATGPADARGRVGGSAEAASPAAPSLRQLTPPASLLLVAAAGAWAGVVLLARDMGSMPGTMGLGAGSFVAVWVLMMAAMMLPAVVPFASLYSRTFTDGRGSRLVAFASGYLIVWTMAALPAYGLAWLAGRLAGGHSAAATVLAVAIFAACGAYQLTPVKDRCLARCRSPLGFMLKLGAYRGRTRVLRAGLYHGTFCVACCWALMAVLVAFGLMNVIAMVILAGAVLAEKTWARGTGFSRALGVAALGLAVAVVFEPGLASGLHYAGTGGMGGM